MKKLKNIIYTHWFNVFLDCLVRLYSNTLRYDIKGEKTWQEMISTGKPVVICCWHQQFFPLVSRVTAYQKFHPAVMISKSRDGDLVAPIAIRRSCRPIRGSSSNGGRSALDKLIDHVNKYGFAFHVLDGPTGPMGRVKPGVIKLARQTGAALLPVHIESDHAWFFGSWDHFMLPKPFARVKLKFGKPVQLSENQDDACFEKDRKLLENTMYSYLTWPQNKN